MAHILITGAGGYIGSVLTSAAIAKGHQVTAVDRFFFGQEALRDVAGNERFYILRNDIRDLTPRDFEGVDAVFDLAALSNDPSSDLDPSLTEAVNFKGRLHVATCAKEAGVGRYILSSSCSVYGHGETSALTEESPTAPLTTYAKSSLRAEEETAKLASADFCWSTIRNATVFGLSPRMRFDLVVNLMTLNAVQKGRIFVLGGGRQWRPLVHVRDVAHCFLSIVDAPTNVVNRQVFNLGLANYQVLRLAYIVRETLPFRIEIEVAPDDTDKRDYNVSFDKIKRVLGFEVEQTIPDGIREVYEALKSGQTEATAKTSTVGWYRNIIEADRLLNQVRLNGRLL
jgi:nucleoside-diphosphate-sugar epimerase